MSSVVSSSSVKRAAESNPKSSETPGKRAASTSPVGATSAAGAKGSGSVIANVVNDSRKTSALGTYKVSMHATV